MAVTLSYPKPRTIQYKFFEIARTDSATEKCILPKGCYVVDLEVCQTVGATTAAATFDLGWSDATDGLIDGFSMALTTPVGLVKIAATADPQFGVVLTADRKIISTYIAGSSTAGGTGWVKIGYVMPGPGETMFS